MQFITTLLPDVSSWIPDPMARRIAGELVQKSLEKFESEAEDQEAARLSPEYERSLATEALEKPEAPWG